MEGFFSNLVKKKPYGEFYPAVLALVLLLVRVDPPHVLGEVITAAETLAAVGTLDARILEHEKAMVPWNCTSQESEILTLSPWTLPTWNLR